MAEKRNWLCICKKGESHIFTQPGRNRPAMGKRAFLFVAALLGFGLLQAQNFSRQQVVFSLFDKNGTQLTNAAITTGKVRVYTLREAKTITHSHLSYDRSNKYFTFGESAISPGMMLALVSGVDTMYLSLYGRANGRTIDGLRVHKGSFVLTSDDFAGQKSLKVDNWSKYLEDGQAPQQQDLSSYRALLKNKKPVQLVDHPH